MYRDHRFLYVEPSSVYLHLYGTIYIQYLCLYDVYLEYLFYCYISDYPYACEEFWIVALSLHLRYHVLLIFKKICWFDYESVKMKVGVGVMLCLLHQKKVQSLRFLKCMMNTI